MHACMYCLVGSMKKKRNYRINNDHDFFNNNDHEFDNIFKFIYIYIYICIFFFIQDRILL